MNGLIRKTVLWLLILTGLLLTKTLKAQTASLEIQISIDYIEPGQEINLSPDGETAVIHITSYSGFNESTLISSIQQQIEYEGAEWITDVFLTNKVGNYEADLNIVFEENDGYEDREVTLTAQNTSALITQGIHTPNVYTLLPNRSDIYLLHGGKNTLTLSSSDGFASYRLLKDTANNVTITVSDVNGKSEGNRQLKFSINSPGAYYCVAYYPTEVMMNGTRNVQWHPFYDTTRNCSLNPNPYTISKDGGCVSFTYNVTSDQDSILQRIVNFYNSGNCTVWDTTMVLSYTRLSPAQVRMTVEAGPNVPIPIEQTSPYAPSFLYRTIENNTYFRNSAGNEIAFTQPSGGEIKAYRVYLPENSGAGQTYLILDSTQCRVRYALFKDGVQVGPARAGHGDSLHLSFPADSGKFTVMGQSPS